MIRTLARPPAWAGPCRSVFDTGFRGGAPAGEGDAPGLSSDPGNLLTSGTDGGLRLTSAHVSTAIDGVAGGSAWRLPGGETLPTRAALEAIAVPASVQGLRTSGFAAPGDGGAAAYVRVASEPAHSGKLRTADGAWWSLRADAAAVSVRQFGAVGDGVADDTAAFQSGLDWLAERVATAPGDAGGGGLLWVPRGDYRIADTLSVVRSNVTLAGEGGGAAVIRGVTPGRTVLRVRPEVWPGGAPLSGIAVRDLTFVHDDANPTAGAQIEATGLADSAISGLRLIGHYRGIDVAAPERGLRIEGCDIRDAAAEGVRVEGGVGVRLSGLALRDTGGGGAPAQLVLSDVTDVLVSGLHVSGGAAASAMRLEGSTDRVVLADTLLSGQSGEAVAVACTGRALALGTLVCDESASLASAATIAPSAARARATVTGDATILRIEDGAGDGNAAWDGRALTLVFTGNATVATGGNIALGTPFAARPGDSLSLVYAAADGLWSETARSRLASPVVSLSESGTLGADRADAYLRSTADVPITLTLAADFPVGAWASVRQAGSGSVTIAPGPGMSLDARDGLVATAGHGSVATLLRVSETLVDLVVS